MKLAILSDSHDNQSSVLAALALLADIQPDQILHLGDICSPEIISVFNGQPVRFCYGNCDWDRTALKTAVRSINCEIEYNWQLELGNKKILACHGDRPLFLKQAIESQEFDYVFHGHSHEQRDEHFGKTRVINPGALQRAGVYSFAVLETERDELRFIELAKDS